LRVVLFDQATDGHHLEYATWLSTYLREAGDEVTFVTLTPPAPEVDLAPISAVASLRYATSDAIRSSVDQTSLRRLGRATVGCRFAVDIARRQGADILHYLYLDRIELPMAAGAFRRATPFATFGTLFWPYFVRRGRDPADPAKLAYHALVRRLLGRMLRRGTLNGLFVHSERTRSLLLGTWGPQLSHRIHVVPDPAIQSKDVGVQKSRRQLGLPDRGSLLLFFGALRYDKGPDVLLEALQRLRGDWHAVIAGRPGWLSEAEAARYRSRLTDPARLILRLGFVSDADVPSYFEAADAVVLPYRSAFLGTSGVLQRAAGAGKPVIATDVGDIGSTVRTAGLGMVVDPDDPEALRQALQEFLDAGSASVVGVEERARRYAQSTDWRVLGELVRRGYRGSMSS
jgi:glycosyltransferase involved in cell wall biosynthesis